jgi:protein TonB
MAEATFLEQKKLRPGAALTVILMHGAALTALLLAKTDIGERIGFTPIDTWNVPVPPPPPPPPRTPEPDRPRAEQRHVVDSFIPPLPPDRGITTAETTRDPPDLGSRPGGEETGGSSVPDRGVVIPPADPIRLPAQMIGSNLQPPYPTSEQRMEREGRVVIQVTIGPDGRVIAVRRVNATSDAFWEATERHARRSWRFRPATVDGRPVESTRTLTVHFQMDG